MTNYLHRLAPGMHRDTLLSHGNYQASFYVDNRLVYQTNLLPGAPQPWLQDTVTVMSKPLISDKSSWWSQSMWNRFMVNGGDSVLTDGPHALPLVIVVTATAYGAYYAHPQVDKMMENYILPAVLTDCTPVRRGAGSRP